MPCPLFNPLFKAVAEAQSYELQKILKTVFFIDTFPISITKKPMQMQLELPLHTCSTGLNYRCFGVPFRLARELKDDCRLRSQICTYMGIIKLSVFWYQHLVNYNISFVLLNGCHGSGRVWDVNSPKTFLNLEFNLLSMVVRRTEVVCLSEVS